MKQLGLIFFAISLILFSGIASFAQESEAKVVDEVIAQVNDGVITLSRIKNETKGVIDTYVQDGKTREEAEKLVEAKKGELIANLINEELLVQKAKEMNMDADIDASLNQRFKQIMDQYHFTKVEQLEAEMKKQGVDPQEIREIWRKQAIREAVLRQEVQSKVYWAATPTELKAYFDAHKDKFTTPETVGMSEIFLSFAGRDPAVVREKAKEIAKLARTGVDFEKLVVENSDRQDAATTKGKVDPINVKDLDPKFATAIKGLKVGDISDPVEVGDTGISILKIDVRTQQSSDAKFDENAVRMAILNEKAPQAQKDFLAKLRDEAYIKINDAYRPIVSPILFADERKDKTEKTANK